MSFGGKYSGEAWVDRNGKVKYKAKFNGYATSIRVEKILARSLPEASSSATRRCIDAVDKKKKYLDDDFW